MAKYDYECTDCGHRFEAEHPMAQENGAECPECGFWTVKKVILSAPPVKFKGYGWPDKSFTKTMEDVTAEQRKRDKKRDKIGYEQEWANK